MSGAITVPSVIERFRVYHALPGNCAWGSLHVVLDDCNFENGHVQYSIDAARQDGDSEGAALGEILLQMSRTQRAKISREAVK